MKNVLKVSVKVISGIVLAAAMVACGTSNSHESDVASAPTMIANFDAAEELTGLNALEHIKERDVWSCQFWDATGRFAQNNASMTNRIQQRGEEYYLGQYRFLLEDSALGFVFANVYIELPMTFGGARDPEPSKMFFAVSGKTIYTITTHSKQVTRNNPRGILQAGKCDIR